MLGTGYRATTDQLAPDAAARVRRACSARLAGDRVTAVETNVIYAVARKDHLTGG